MSISRRDFLNGAAITLGGAGVVGAASMLPWRQWLDTSTETAGLENGAKTAITQNHPPSKMGLRGNHEGSFETAHQLAWQKRDYDISTIEVQEHYDLVVVGAGISGLTAAYLYHQQYPQSRILIVDNHDDFGGHAKRNELVNGDVMRISFGGSESFDAPEENFDEQVTSLLASLGVDYQRFAEFYNQRFNDEHGLGHGMFYSKAAFGRSQVVAADPYFGDATAREAFTDAPLSDAVKQELIALYDEPEDYLHPMPSEQREAYLSQISYAQFLQQHASLTADAMAVLQDISSEYWGFGIDGMSALDAYWEGYPGLGNLGLEEDDSEDEPYIYHFPDGNASIARLLVRAMIPEVSSLNDQQRLSQDAMQSIVLDQFDYHALDNDDHPVRLRLNSTVVKAQNTPKGVVEVGYVQDDNLYKLIAKKVIMAGNHRLNPYMLPDSDDSQNAAFALNVKVPLIYGKVMVSNWRAFKKLGVHELYCPKSAYCLVQLDYPVSMGDYEFAKSEDEPMVIHMVRVPTPFATGLSVREMCQMGRHEVYTKSYEELEEPMLAQLKEIFALAGESLDEALLAVTINRWGHGYSYEENELWDDETAAEQVQQRVQQPIGNIHIANSDAAWGPYMHVAIQQGVRAVNEVMAV